MRAVVVEGAVDPTPAGLPVLIAGRYLLGPLLGRGGAAEVYRAHDQVLGRAVAVKIFLNGVPTTDPRRQHREIITLAGFSHPALVTLYNAGEQDGRAFFVMQLVSGRTLADRLREHPLPAADTTQLGVELADALAYVHARGVIHRDVKPANVLLDEHNRPHLSDFGIATMIDSTQITHTGLMIGTAAYLAPEQVRGHPVGPEADIYALGLVLLECLTGQREYPGQPMEAALARLHRQPHVPQDLPAPMTAALQAMTANDPDQRPTAAEVLTWLREDTPPTVGATKVLGAPPPSAPLNAPVPASPAPRQGSSVPAPGIHRRRRAPVGALLLGALLVALGLGLALPLRSNTPAPTTPQPGVTLPATPPVPAPIPSPPADTQTPATRIQPSPSLTAEQPAPPTNPAPSPNTPADTQTPATRTQPSPSPTAEQPAPLTNPAPIPNTPADTQAPATRIQPSPSPTAEQPSPPPSTVSPTSPPATTAPTPPPTPTPTPTPPSTPPSTPTSRKKPAPPGGTSKAGALAPAQQGP